MLQHRIVLGIVMFTLWSLLAACTSQNTPSLKPSLTNKFTFAGGNPQKLKQSIENHNLIRLVGSNATACMEIIGRKISLTEMGASTSLPAVWLLECAEGVEFHSWDTVYFVQSSVQTARMHWGDEAWRDGIAFRTDGSGCWLSVDGSYRFCEAKITIAGASGL